MIEKYITMKYEQKMYVHTTKIIRKSLNLDRQKTTEIFNH